MPRIVLVTWDQSVIKTKILPCILEVKRGEKCEIHKMNIISRILEIALCVCLSKE